MRPARTITVAVATAVAVSTAVAGGWSATHASAADAPIAWKACADDATAQCGTLRVPVDWSRPQGATLEMAVARVPAADPAHRIGSLVVNPGGPGASGVAFALGARAILPQEIRDRFDLVGFDPRGIGQSQPILCDQKLSPPVIVSVPDSPQEFAALVARNRALRADCRRRNGTLTDHVDTGSVARDMEALRQAIGDRQLTYFGASYGSLIGQQYAELYGDRIRAMVLDGNVDHNVTLPGFVTDAARFSEDGLADFARWCDKESACAVHGRPVLAEWAAALSAADQRRLWEGGDTDGIPADTDYSIQRLYGLLLRGDQAGIADWLATLTVGKVWPDDPPAGTAAAPADLEVNDRTMVLCEDWTPRAQTFGELRALVAAQRKAAPNVRYNPEAMELLLNCAGWPRQAPNPPHRLKLGTGSPILLSNAEHDPVSGMGWAESLQRQAPQRFALLRYGGLGHVAYPRTDCVVKSVDAYLLRGALPAAGCPAAPGSGATGAQASTFPLAGLIR
jgi:pimeloyl-ACP methyl ester carboxylesterase